MDVILITQDGLSSVYSVEETVDKMRFGIFKFFYLSFFASTIWVCEPTLRCITRFCGMDLCQLVDVFEVMAWSILLAAPNYEWNWVSYVPGLYPQSVPLDTP